VELDSTLSDACKLLDTMGSCNPSARGDCSDFKKTRSVLKEACDIKQRRDDRGYDPSQWMTIGDHEIKKLDRNGIWFIIYVIALFVPTAILLTFIHESGHWIAVKAFGWEVIDFKISFFPFVIDLNEYLAGYVSYIPITTPQPWQTVLVSAAGSLHSLAWAYIFFALFYNFKFNRYVEMFFILYSILLGLDSVIYIFFGIFVFHDGDWWQIFQISPATVGVIFALSMLNVLLFIVFFKKIRNRMDITI